MITYPSDVTPWRLLPTHNAVLESLPSLPAVHSLTLDPNNRHDSQVGQRSKCDLKDHEDVLLIPHGLKTRVQSVGTD